MKVYKTEHEANNQWHQRKAIWLPVQCGQHNYESEGHVLLCGNWCAWFSIQQRVVKAERPPKRGEVFPKAPYACCKGTPLHKIEEE